MELEIIETHVQRSPDEQICFYCEQDNPHHAIIPPYTEYHLVITADQQQLEICNKHFATLQQVPPPA